MANLMLSVTGAFAGFERSLIRERQREGIALAKQRGAPTRGEKRPSHRNGPPNWSSAPAAVSRKPYLPMTTESAGKRPPVPAPRQAGVNRSPAGAVVVPAPRP